MPFRALGKFSEYRFRPDFCEAADPESKGIVENLVGYAKDDLAVPLFAETPEGERPSLAAANQAALGWCEEVNAAVHSETMAVPAERLEQERALLAGLPSLQLRIGPAPVLRKVDKLACIRFGSARYSVPMVLVGTRVEVISDQGRILVVDTGTGEVVADHAAVPPGEASIADEHYGGARPLPRRAVRPRTVAEKEFCALGPVAEAFLPVPPRPVTPGFGRNSASCPGSTPRTAATRCSPRWNAPPPSPDGAPPTSDRS